MPIDDIKNNSVAWSGDKLNRKDEGEFLANYMVNKFTASTAEDGKDFVLNINADWGFGKTYFLKNLSLDLEGSGHQVVYFDAWKNDFSDKPMLGFISEISEGLSSFMSNNELKPGVAKKIAEKLKVLKKSAAPLMAGFLAKQLVGASFEQIEKLYDDDSSDDDDDDDDGQTSKDTKDLENNVATTISSITTKAAEFALKEHVNTKNSIDTFKVNLKGLIDHIQSETEKKLPLFILVDELDRCRPSYAIELLETIKHLFEVDGVYFIVATASHQLSHSINAVYGVEFESKRYLNRFFDQEYKLAAPNQYEYCQYQWVKYVPKECCLESLINDDFYSEGSDVDINTNALLVDFIAQYMRAGLRDIEQAIKLIQVINLTYKDKLYSILIMYLIFCKIRHPDLYSMVKDTWPNMYVSHHKIINRIEEYEDKYFRKEITLRYYSRGSYNRKGDVVATSLNSVFKGLLAQNGVELSDTYNNSEDPLSPKGLLFSHFQSQNGGRHSVNNPPKIKFLHYIEIVDQVGRLC